MHSLSPAPSSSVMPVSLHSHIMSTQQTVMKPIAYRSKFFPKIFPLGHLKVKDSWRVKTKGLKGDWTTSTLSELDWKKLAYFSQPKMSILMYLCNP